MTVADVAEEQADRVAAVGGVRVRNLTHRHELAALLDLFDEVWSLAPTARPLSKDLLLAMAHAGNPVLGAFDGAAGDGPLVGGSLGVLGSHAPGVVHVHSHMTGVRPDLQHRGIGRALKLHQRAWALTHGITSVSWTFDPLVRRNGWFNLQVLGAVGRQYLPDFYGPLDDAINGGDETDRLLVWWDLASPRAVEAAATGLAPTPAVPPGTPCLLAPAGNGNGAGDEPLLTPLAGDGPADPAAPAICTIEVPDDIVAIRRRDPALGRRWRYAVRQAMSGALDQGFEVDGMVARARFVLRRAR